MLDARGHTEACRARIEAALDQDPEGREAKKYRGMAAREIFTRRDLITGKPKEIQDDKISKQQFDNRTENNQKALAIATPLLGAGARGAPLEEATCVLRLALTCLNQQLDADAHDILLRVVVPSEDRAQIFYAA